MDIKQVTYHALQIEKCNRVGNYGNIMPHLTALDYACMTSEHLEDTNIVKVLYRLLKTCLDPSVKETVKHLLSKWKKLYNHPYHTSADRVKEEFTTFGESTRAGGPCPTERVELAVAGKPVELCDSCEHVFSHTGFRPDRASNSVTELVKDSEERVSPSCQPTGDSSSRSTLITVSNASATSAPTSEASTPLCKDIGESDLRSKCIQLLLGALEPETSKQAEGKTADLARIIEEHIHALQSKNQVKYKACIRSKVSNLRNPKTGHLRQGLMDGSLEPEVFARMSVEDMASEDLQWLRKQYSLRGVSERQLPQGVEGTPTQKLRCRRCEALDCRVTQVSRGTLFLPAWVRQATADQDAMTFVTCSRCGEQWYHSGWICL